MAEFPHFPLWTDAYLGDTHHLTTIEHGAYLLLLIAMWRTGEARLSCDDRVLAKTAHLTMKQWKRIKPELMPFFENGGGHITQGRLTDEWHYCQTKSKKQSDKAKARWLKHKNLDDAVAMPRQCPLPTPTPIEERKQDSSLRSDANGNGKESYAFEYRGIRLTEKNFRQWQKAYPFLDLNAELTAIACGEWFAGLGSGWFPAVSNALNKRNATEKRKRDPQKRQHHWTEYLG